MTMRVKQIKSFLDKIGRILDVYESYSLEEMLDDIYLKISSNGEINQTKKSKEKPLVNFNEIQEKIQQIDNQEEIIGELSKLDKDVLIDFGRFVDIRVSKKDNKLSIARTIAGHINFSNLNQKISQRDKQLS